MSKIYATVSYHRYKLEEFKVFYGTVKDSMYAVNVSLFPSPPLSLAAFEALINAYQTARTNYTTVSKNYKGIYESATEALMEGLDSLGTYVTTTAANNPDIIISAGFVPNKTSQSSGEAPAIPNLPKVTRTDSIATAEVDAVAGAEYYIAVLVTGSPMPSTQNIVKGQLVISEGGMAINGAMPGTVVAVFDLSKSRRKAFAKLQPNTSYYVYFAAGNAKGVSSFSVGNIL